MFDEGSDVVQDPGSTTQRAVLLRAVAAEGIPGTLADPPAAPLPDDVWDGFLHDVCEEHLTGHLVQAVMAGRWPVTSRQRSDVIAVHGKAMSTALTLENLHAEVVDVLETAGVETRVVTGCAVARLDYDPPQIRSFGDVDLLVRREQSYAARVAVAGLGCLPLPGESRRVFDRRSTWDARLVTVQGVEVHLHHTLAGGPYGQLVRTPDLWRDAAPFVLAERTMHALSQDLRFLDACFRLRLGPREGFLVTQRDVVQMALSDRLDVDRVRETAEHWGAEAVVAEAIATAWDTLDVADMTRLSTWARRYRPRKQDVRRLRAYQ